MNSKKLEHQNNRMTLEQDSEEIYCYEEQHKRILSDVSNLFVLLNPPQIRLASVLSLWQMGCAIPMHPEVLVRKLLVCQFQS